MKQSPIGKIIESPRERSKTRRKKAGSVLEAIGSISEVVDSQIHLRKKSTRGGHRFLLESPVSLIYRDEGLLRKMHRQLPVGLDTNSEIEKRLERFLRLFQKSQLFVQDEGRDLFLPESNWAVTADSHGEIALTWSLRSAQSASNQILMMLANISIIELKHWAVHSAMLKRGTLLLLNANIRQIEDIFKTRFHVWDKENHALVHLSSRHKLIEKFRLFEEKRIYILGQIVRIEPKIEIKAGAIFVNYNTASLGLV